MKILRIIKRIQVFFLLKLCIPTKHPILLLAFPYPHQQYLWALILLIPISICSPNRKKTVNVILGIYCDNFVTFSY